MNLVAYDPSHPDALVDLTLRAWDPVFASIEQAMTSEIFRAQHPDWRADQRAAVVSVCEDPDVHVRVALEGDEPVGFAALRCSEADRMGEIWMIGVDPEHHRRGIARALTEYAFEWFRSEGMTTAMVETGGDPGHAPARATYEAAGFHLVPVARYFKKL